VQGHPADAEAPPTSAQLDQIWDHIRAACKLLEALP